MSYLIHVITLIQTIFPISYVIIGIHFLPLTYIPAAAALIFFLCHVLMTTYLAEIADFVEI